MGRRLCSARNLRGFRGMQKTMPRFVPPHCPRPECLYHKDSTGWKFRKAGSYRRRSAPKRVQRFLCVHCGRCFSEQTFRIGYWLKRPELLPIVFRRILSCSSYRQIGRELGVTHSTTRRHTARLGRHCLLFQHSYRLRVTLSEPLVIDGFESFEFSQYHPIHFHVAVGADSQFFHAFTDSELRRKGRMTSYQKDRRSFLESQFGRPDPRSIEKEVAELLRLVRVQKDRVVLHSDDHPAYRRALKLLPSIAFDHRITSSKRRRTPRNPLFPINWLDLLIRHSSSNHKRETIAFSKRRQNAAEKLAILQVWRNFIKPLTEKRGEPPPAARLGLVDSALAVETVLAQRLFPSRIALPPRLAAYYGGRVETRRIPNGRRHELKLAI